MDLSQDKSRHPEQAFRRGLDHMTCAEIIYLARETMSYAFSRTTTSPG